MEVSPKTRRNLRSESCSLVLSCSALSLVLLVSLVSGCKKRTAATAPPLVTGPQEAPVRASNPPTLEASLGGGKGSGGSIWLVWKSDNADSVVIDNGIGDVLLQGRIQLPPHVQTTYTVTAHGPGGSTSRKVRVHNEVQARTDSSVTGPKACSLEEEFSLQVKTVYFELDRPRLGDKARRVLDESIAWLTRSENDSIRFTVEGYSDPVGSEEFGHAVGDVRASLVRAYMIERGIDEGRILAVSLGGEGSTAEQREEFPGQNGRTAFVLSRKELED